MSDHVTAQVVSRLNVTTFNDSNPYVWQLLRNSEIIANIVNDSNVLLHDECEAAFRVNEAQLTLVTSC
jgi:hypothetical protein